MLLTSVLLCSTEYKFSQLPGDFGDSTENFFSVPQQQSIRYDFIWCYQANHRITCICHICAMKNAWQNHTIKIITESLAVADKENAIYKIRWIF